MFKQSLRTFFGNNFEIIALLVFSIIVYFRWFSAENFVSSDWPYTSAQGLRDFFSISTWSNLTSFGKVNLNLWRLPIAYLQGLFGVFGFGTNIADKIVFFLPVALFIPLVSYFFSKKLSKSRVGGVIGSLFFSYNSYFLAIDSQGHLGITLSAGLIMLVMLFLYKFEKTKNIYSTVPILTFLICLIGFYDFRFVYVLALILSIHFLYRCLEGFSVVKNLLNLYIKVGLIYLGLNVFWLIPFIASSATSSGVIFSRPLWRSELFTLTRAIVTHQPFWNPDNFIWHKVGQIPLYLWMPVLFIVAGYTLYSKKNKDIRLYFLIFLFGILLSKQESAPFVDLYRWLFAHVPGFGAFREASKFYVISIVSCTALISICISGFLSSKRNNFIKGSLLISLVAVLTINSLYLAIGKISGIYLPVTMPNSYLEMHHLIESSKENFRILWLPEFGVNWGLFSQKIAAINYYETSGKLSDDMAPWRELMIAEESGSMDKGVFDVLKNEFMKDVLNTANVRYLAIPRIAIGDTKNPFRIENRNELQSSLNEITFFKKVLSDHFQSGQLDIYEVEGENRYIFPFTAFTKPLTMDKQTLNFASELNGDEPAYFSFDNENIPQVYSTIERLFSNQLAKVGSKQFNSSLIGTSTALVRSDMKLVSNKEPRIYVYQVDRNGDIKIEISSSGKISISNISISNEKRSIDIPHLNKGEILSVDGDFYDSNSIFKLNKKISNSSHIYIYKTADTNLENGDFEAGLWEKAVRDCNHTDDHASLGMSVKRYILKNNSKFLELTALRHTACTKKSFDVMSGSYLLSIKHQSPSASNGSYYIGFNSSKENVRGEFVSKKDSWSDYWAEIKVPEGTTSSDIYLYSKPMGEGRQGINRYDDVKIHRIIDIQDISIDNFISNKHFKIDLQDNKQINYSNDFYSEDQLIKNASFEVGSWQDNVGDCDNYDNDPQIAANTTQEFKTEGTRSIELRSTRHAACISVDVPVKPGSTYSLSFDYQSSNAPFASFYIGFNDPQKTSIKKQLPITNANWQRYSEAFAAPRGATKLLLYIYARESDKKTMIINHYDNFRLVAVPDLTDAFYLISDAKKTTARPHSVAFNQESSTKKNLYISGATKPFFIGMSEGYHDRWGLEMKNEKVSGLINGFSPFSSPDRVRDEYHYKLDGFLNAWYVDTEDLCVKQQRCTKNADGSYDLEMTIEFWPQRWFYLGLIISGTTLVSCLSYLAFDGVRTFRRIRKAKQELL